METRTEKWNKRFMALAHEVAGWSKDQSTKVGCVIVGPNNEIRSTGYNGFPRGVDDTVPARHERPAKYKWTEHAERNAIYNAAFTGVSLKGCRIYIPWYPCADCCRAIIQAGIREIIAYEPESSHATWGEDFIVSSEMIKEAGIKLTFLEDKC